MVGIHGRRQPSTWLDLPDFPYFRPTVTEEELREAFSEHGEVKAFKFFQ